GMITETSGSPTMSCPPLDRSRKQLSLHPGNDLIEHRVQGRRCAESKDALRFPDIRNALVDVVLERLIGDVSERLLAVDLLPDELCQLEHRRALSRRQVEVLIDRGLGLDRQPDPDRQIAAVGVVADLSAVAEDVQ